MRRLAFIFSILMTVVILSSCRKDVSPPTIRITNPADLRLSASVGDTVLLEGTFTDPKELGRLEMVELINNSTQNTLKVIEDFDSETSHVFSETYVIGTDRQVGDEIQIDFIGYDEPGNNTIGRIQITVE